jgi:hypothetical protein
MIILIALLSKYFWLVLSCCELCSREDIDYLEQMPYTISLPQYESIIVHAGLVPQRSISDQIPGDMTLMRNIAVNKSFGGGNTYETFEHGKQGLAWAAVWPGPTHVYFGHDAKRGLQTELHATGLDSGCCYGRIKFL